MNSINYQRMIKGNWQIVENACDYFLFTYVPEQCAWVFTTYIDPIGRMIDPKEIRKDSFVAQEAAKIANSLYIESGLWVL